MIVEGRRTPAFDEVFDYVIVGSGAAGASAARVLVDTGASVCVLEEGPAVRTEEFTSRAFPTFNKMLRGAGTQVARGRAFIPVLQGRCLGGSTVINSAIVWRLPEDVWEPWARVYGLGEALPLRALHAEWDLIEKELSVAETPREVWGELNRLMDVASAKLRVSAAPIRRYVKGCRASASCLTGCRHGAKQSMLVSYIPYAEKKGATILSDAHVTKIVMDGSRAVGVDGRLGSGGKLRARARRAVIVAASAIQTPELLQRSGLGTLHVGLHFQGHPGCALVGMFDRKVDMWTGATQGFDCDEHRKEGRYKIETVTFPPEVAFVRMPGAGKRWVRELAKAGHALTWAVQMRAWAEGTVKRRPWGLDIAYDLTPRDVVSLRRGLRFTAELLFAAGAKEVLTGVHGLPERLAPGQEWMFEHGPSDPAAYSMILSHLFGTARMSKRASDGAVGTDFGFHGASGLYVVDSSIFPTNTSVNPQHTIMAAAMHAARRISETA